MKKNILVAMAIVAAILLIGVYLWQSHRTNTNTEEIRLSGTIEITSVDISPEIAERVIGINHFEGEPVKKGEPLITLDNNTILSNLRAAQAAEKTAAAQISLTKEQMENARKTLTRFKKLYDQKAIPESKYDDAKTVFKTASDTHVMAMNSLEEVRARIDSLNILLKKTEISSPIDGIILERNVEVGEITYPGEILMIIGDTKKPWARIYIEEPTLPKVNLGQKAFVVTDAYPNKRLEGILRYIANKAEFTPKQIETRQERVRLVFEAKVYINNDEGILKPGLPVDVYLPIK